jgi:CubicO group peptidase (beta-lactamase class C family)
VDAVTGVVDPATGRALTSETPIFSASTGQNAPTPPDTPTLFGWSGAGGSHASADTAAGIAFALTKNRFTTTDFSTAAHVFGIVMRSFGES